MCLEIRLTLMGAIRTTSRGKISTLWCCSRGLLENPSTCRFQELISVGRFLNRAEIVVIKKFDKLKDGGKLNITKIPGLMANEASEKMSLDPLIQDGYKKR